jgi:hypothetical protein
MMGAEHGTLSGEQAETLEELLGSEEPGGGIIGDEAPHFVFEFRPRFGPRMTLTSYADGRYSILRSGIPFGRTDVGTNTRLTAWLEDAVQ